MLELSVRMLDDMLRLRPVGGRVDADLVILIRGEQLGAVQWVEIGCEDGTLRTMSNLNAKAHSILTQSEVP